MHTKMMRVFIAVCVFFTMFPFAHLVQAQPANGANKFLGNITTNGQVRPDFLTYWNQITAENEHKWQSVEGTRDNMNWGGGDRIVNYANENGILWKFHTLVWGSQYPSWMDGLSQSEQLAEIEEWYDAVKQRYPEIPMIDVVNEAMPSHAPAPFKNALGGDGATGYDYIIKAFEMARERWPNAILMYNDYNNIEYDADVQYTYDLVNAMINAGAPIDAVGCQAHDAYKRPTSSVKSNIDKLASLGLPIFITEYDIGEGDDNRQKQIMEEQFTMFWNHPKIAGITYWGYIMGATWRDNTGLMQSNGAERPALTWLKQYVSENPNPPNDFPDLLNIGGEARYRLAVSTRGQGTVSPTPEESGYEKDTEVTITATPSEGWVFDGWSGDVDGDQNPLTVTMNATTQITANFVTEGGKQDLVVNGNFSSGADSWTFNMWDGDGQGGVVEGEYRMTVNTIAAEFYDIQVVQPNIPLEQGKTYRVMFDAYASEQRVLNVNVGMPVEPYTTFLSDVEGETELTLSTSKASYNLDFTMEEPDYDSARVEFSVGSATGTVYLDNVSFVEIVASNTVASVKKTAERQMTIVPTGGAYFNIDFSIAGKGDASLKIYDLRGNVIHSANLNNLKAGSHTYPFDSALIPNGYYIARLFNGGKIQQAKMTLVR